MAEQLYTIPVNEAFEADCECPICQMVYALERNVIEFTLGPSYMEDDVRMETNRFGFCEKHVKLLYMEQNRLGLALMLLTHMDEVIKNMEEKQKAGRSASSGFFKKGGSDSAVLTYGGLLDQSCYICNRIKTVFERYIKTIFHLYKKDATFQDKLALTKGFCNKHYLLLYEEAPKQLKGNELDAFTEVLNQVYLNNLKRVRDDLEWYTDKFDYRNQDAPWKNSKDVIPRSITKLNSVMVD